MCPLTRIAVSLPYIQRVSYLKCKLQQYNGDVNADFATKRKHVVGKKSTSLFEADIWPSSNKWRHIAKLCNKLQRSVFHLFHQTLGYIQHTTSYIRISLIASNFDNQNFIRIKLNLLLQFNSGGPRHLLCGLFCLKTLSTRKNRFYFGK